MGEPGCDFCTVREAPAWIYPATDFVMENLGGVDHVSTGGWLACDPCSTLIEDEDWVGLKLRSIETYFEGRTPPDWIRGEVATKVGALHAEFRKHRKDLDRRPFG